jgi:hypothetical protein
MTINLSRQEAKALLTKPKRSKYGATKTMLDGITFDSKREAKRWQELRLLEKAGEISHLERQPKFLLYGKDGPVLIKSDRYHNGRHAAWFGDFSYFCSRRNKRICEDVKGIRTPMFILKKAVVLACYPGLEIVEI